MLSQEVLRGSVNANLVGALRGVPVVTYMGIAPVEYFRCRRERRQIGPVKARPARRSIRAMMTVNGRLAARVPRDGAVPARHGRRGTARAARSGSTTASTRLTSALPMRKSGGGCG